MEPVGNDRFAASFPVDELGRYEYTVTAWTDPFASWHRDLEKKLAAGQDVALDLLVGAGLLEQSAHRAAGSACPG